jgi:hypothetical protein
MVPFMIPLSYKIGIIKNTTNQPLKQAQLALYHPHNIAYAFEVILKRLGGCEFAIVEFVGHLFSSPTFSFWTFLFHQTQLHLIFL